ncbi:uncharacterized protein ACR2FA_002528 [Aphomia sociella]
MKCPTTTAVLQDDYLDGPYEYCPVDNEYGSCVNYKKRKQINKNKLKDVSYNAVLSEYGDRLCMVASIEERWRALAPHLPITHLLQLSPIHYCMLELTGKSRDNGQITIGKTNLTKIIKDPKLQFYNRKILQDMDLIRVSFVSQTMAGKGIKSIILRLKRFYKSKIQSMPKVGKIHDLVTYLKDQPNYSERTDVILKNGFISQQMNRRLRKSINVFNYGEKFVEETTTSRGTKRKHPVTRRFITLSCNSDESSNSEDETSEPPPKFRYKVGQNLLRQAYERFLDAGLKGLTQVELAHMLGIEFYTARTICKIYKGKGIVRERLEDRGRQRTARFVAVADTTQLDLKYAEEKKKLLEYIDMNKIIENVETPSVSGENTVKIKNQKDILMNQDDVEDNVIIEVKTFDGYENVMRKSLVNSKKSLTLRQLKYANGLLKILKEKHCVSGYQKLSNLVGREIGESPMDTKALKIFLQRLVIDGQIKILKLKWPTPEPKYSTLVCSHHVKATDPIIKAKYKEICMRAYITKEIKTEEATISKNFQRPATMFTYPRYVKIQKLHELVVKLAYFNDSKEPSELPFGFGSLLDLIPEMTVEFAVGYINNFGNLNIGNLIVNDETLHLKLRDAPPRLYKKLLQSKSLQNALKANLKTLAALGLIQLLTQTTGVDSVFFVSGHMYFVNRYAKIIDTTGAWPRKNVEVTDLEKSFYFETPDEVTKFWTAVYQISIKTVIELKTREQNKKLIPPLRTQKEVLQIQYGEKIGDGMGPCGYDSSFFMEIPRLWNNNSGLKLELFKPPKVLPKKVKFSKIEKPKTKIKKKKIKHKVIAEEVSIPDQAKKRKRSNDSLITWTSEEDRVIMMCKTAITIMSPTSQPGCLRVRNIVAKDILSIKDPKKTQSVCHRRAILLENDSVLVYERERLLSELRGRRHLIEKYEGLLRKLRIRYPTNIAMYINETRLPLLELVYLINQIRTSKSFNRPVSCIALNLEDFHNKYTIVPNSANKPFNTYKSQHDSELELPTIKEAIMFTVISYSQDVHTSVSRKIFLMLKVFPEIMLRKAVDQLRKCGAITPKEKIFNNKMHKINLHDLVDSSYRPSAAYKRRLMSRLSMEFSDDTATILDSILSQKELKASPSVNCVCFELSACGLMDIITVSPPIFTGPANSVIPQERLSVTDIETKFKLRSGNLSLFNKSSLQSFSELYNSIKIVESLNALSRKAIIEHICDTKVDLQDKIISHLNVKRESGATFNELKELTNYDKITLMNKLLELEKSNVIKRVGYYNNCVILVKYYKPWTITLEKQNISPSPWLSLDLSIKLDIFLEWCGVILNKIFEWPGCSIEYMSEALELITAKSIQDVCEFLKECQCVTMSIARKYETDLFSDDDIEVELEDFNQYESPGNILVFPEKDCVARFSFIRKSIIKSYCTEKEIT